MAKDLELKTNVTAPTADYPSGGIRNDTGAGDGTPVTEAVYGDFHQFFAKILRDANITPNDLPENTTNDFQYNEALVIVANTLDYIATGIVFNATHLEVERVEFINIGNSIKLKGLVRVQNVGDTLLFTLPVGARPNVTKGFSRPATDAGNITDPANDNVIIIQDDGQVIFYYTGITPLSKDICVDGIEFFLS